MSEGLFPQEVVKDVPRVTLTGNDQVHVEQHKGLAAYRPEEVIFRTACGTLCIGGSELRLKRYTACEALVTGQVSSVSIDGVNGGVRA